VRPFRDDRDARAAALERTHRAARAARLQEQEIEARLCAEELTRCVRAGITSWRVIRQRLRERCATR
jgi:hypothetical protein